MSRSRVLGAAVLVALGLLPWLLARHQLSILTDLLIFGLFAMSLDLILGYTGMLSFGHAAYFGLGAYASALVLLEFAQPVPVALLAGMLLAGAVALPVGWLSTRSTGVYFAMLTLAFAQFLYTVAYKWRSLTGGSDGIAGVPKTELFWGGPSLASPHAFYFLAAACVVLSLMLCRALFAPFRGFASPEVMFWVFSGQGLMMVTIGGIGTLVGPILGAMVFILIQEILSSYTEHWMIFTGVVFVLIVIFLPGGLVGTARRLGARG
jgi:branched-chain amino acid transport system permease protein